MRHLRRFPLRMAVAAVAAALGVAFAEGPLFVTQARLSPARWFGRQGVLRSIAAGDRRIDAVSFVDVDAAGGIVVAGTSTVRSTSGGLDDVAPALARFLPDGTLDPVFGDAGIAVLPLRGFPAALTVDAQRRPAISGSFRDPSRTGTGSEAGLVRLTANGVPDASFSSDGFAGDAATGTLGLRFVQASPADRSILAYSERTSDSGGIVRFAEDGTFDASYGNLGLAATEGFFLDLAVDSTGGAIVVSGSSVVRFDAAGRRDLAFGEAGVLVGPSRGTVVGLAVEIDSVGRIVVLGTEGNLPRSLFRFQHTGAVDTTFGEGGIASLALGIPANAEAPQLALGVPRIAEGSYAMCSTLHFSLPNDLSRQSGAFGSLVQSFHPLEPLAVKSLVRRDAKMVHGRQTQTFLGDIAVSPLGQVAYAVGSTTVRSGRGETLRSTPVVLAVDLTRSTPLPMPEFGIEWEGPLDVEFAADHATVNGAVRVTNSGRGGVVNARVVYFLSDDATLDSSDRRLVELTTGALRPRSGKTQSLADLFLPGPAEDLHGRRIIAVINPNGLTPEADPFDDVAVSGPIP